MSCARPDARLLTITVRAPAASPPRAAEAVTASFSQARRPRPAQRARRRPVPARAEVSSQELARTRQPRAWSDELKRIRQASSERSVFIASLPSARRGRELLQELVHP